MSNKIKINSDLVKSLVNQEIDESLDYLFDEYEMPKTHTISVETQDTFNPKNSYEGAYLHGRMYDDYGYDRFSFDEAVPYGEGTHFMTIDGKDVIFFLWPAQPGRVHPWRGLMMYTDDPKLEYAFKKFNERSPLL